MLPKDDKMSIRTGATSTIVDSGQMIARMSHMEMGNFKTLTTHCVSSDPDETEVPEDVEKSEEEHSFKPATMSTQECHLDHLRGLQHDQQTLLDDLIIKVRINQERVNAAYVYLSQEYLKLFPDAIEERTGLINILKQTEIELIDVEKIRRSLLEDFSTPPVIEVHSSVAVLSEGTYDKVRLTSQAAPLIGEEEKR